MPVPEEPKEPVPEEPNDGQTSQKSYVEDAPSDAIDAGSLSMAVADLWEASDFGHLYESEGLSLLWCSHVFLSPTARTSCGSERARITLFSINAYKHYSRARRSGPFEFAAKVKTSHFNYTEESCWDKPSD